MPRSSSPVEEAFIKKNKLTGGDKRVTNDPMEATYVIGFDMWKFRPSSSREPPTSTRFARPWVARSCMSPSGYAITMDAKNHHLHKPVVIGEITEDGQFDIVWQTDGPIRADAWSPYIPDSASKVADWTYPWVCGNCTEPKYQGSPPAVAAGR